MNQETISLFSLALMLIGSTGVSNHVIIIPMLLDASGRDAWLSILLSGFSLLFFIPLLLLIKARMNGERLLPWLQDRAGRPISYVFLAVFILYLFSLSVIVLKETMTFLSFYLPMTPKLFIGVLLAGVCLYNTRHGISSVAWTSGILMPLVILLGFFVATANIPHKDFAYIKPYLEHGFRPVVNGLIYPISGYVELCFVLLLQQHTKKPIRSSFLICVGGVFLVLTLGPTIGAITEFGPFVAARQRYPAFEEWRLVAIGRYIEHVDFLSVYQWLTGAFIRLSLLLFLITDLLPAMNKRKKTGLQMLLLLAITTLSTWSIRDSGFYWFVSSIFIPYSTGCMCLLIVLLALLSVRKKEEKLRGSMG
ncbi:GerAB/ArcD/ProY family transporter [Ectobacillus ponti]|uniref:Endospore germination permease n=1 Tax=Ectobacillus ponti TaxID=2961894 RepID=A0AA41XCL9_9BACI|nr:endospore germination permease [Ectobacillus ponti]MCP8970455.1 endospore germination permease [Ectobacillus ponti]